MSADLGETDLGSKVLVVESQCKGAHDVIPTARKFAQELRRLHGEGYDLALVDGELVEKPRPGQVGQRREDG